MENIGGVDVLQSSEYLIEKIANVVVAKTLSFQQLVKICLHETLDDVDITEKVNVDGTEYVTNINNILVLEGL